MNSLRTIAKLATLVVIGGGTIGAAVGITQAQSFHDAPQSADATNAKFLLLGDYDFIETDQKNGWNKETALEFVTDGNGDYYVDVAFDYHDYFKIFNVEDNILYKAVPDDNEANVYFTCENKEPKDNPAWYAKEPGYYRIYLDGNYKNYGMKEHLIKNVVKINRNSTTNERTFLLKKSDTLFSDFKYLHAWNDNGGGTVYPGNEITDDKELKIEYITIKLNDNVIPNKVLLNTSSVSYGEQKTCDILLLESYDYQVIKLVNNIVNNNREAIVDVSETVQINKVIDELKKERDAGTICSLTPESKLITYFDSLTSNNKHLTKVVSDTTDAWGTHTLYTTVMAARKRLNLDKSNNFSLEKTENIVAIAATSVLAISTIIGFALLVKKRKLSA